MRMQDPAIQPPEALKVQLGEIYQFIYEDESLANRGCRDVWSDLMQLGVKDSLIADFDTFNSTELKQTFDRSSCESILLDGFQKNKSFLEVAEALNSQCADSLELFVFHCFASAEANAFAVANVSGGTRNLGAATATAKVLYHPEWNERESGLGDHLVPMERELPATGHDASERNSFRSDTKQISEDPARDVNQDASPLIEYRRDTSGVGDPSSEGNKVANEVSIAQKTKDIKDKLIEEYIWVGFDVDKCKAAYTAVRDYQRELVNVINKANEDERELRITFNEIDQQFARLVRASCLFPARIDVENLITDGNPATQKAAKYIIFARKLPKYIRYFQVLYARMRRDESALFNLGDLKIIEDEREIESYGQDINKLKRQYNRDYRNMIDNIDKFIKNSGWSEDGRLGKYFQSFNSFSTSLDKLFDDAGITRDEKGIGEFLDFIKKANYVMTYEQDIQDELHPLSREVTDVQNHIRDAVSNFAERVDSYYVSFMSWWTNCWLYSLFT